MIFLIVGEDKYRLNDRLKVLLKVADELNQVSFEEPFEFSKIKNEAETLPFLSGKKVIVVKNLLSSKSSKEIVKSLEEWLPLCPAEVQLIFVEEKINSSSSFVKTVSKYGKLEEYNNLKPFELTKWIEDKTKELGGSIGKRETEKLGYITGTNLVKLENELKKLIAYDSKITDSTIDALIKPEFSQSIFSLMDAIGNKQTKDSMRLLDEFLNNEENELYLLSMIAKQVRNLMIVKDLSENSDASIVKTTGLHPFVVKKTLSQSRNFTKQKLLKMHSQLLKSDLELKSSNIEPKVILTRLILGFVSK